MNFQLLLGDDEHTAADGAYVRVMKARKWIYVSAGIATLYYLGLLQLEELNAWLTFVELPNWLASQVIFAGLIYATVQYVFLTGQLTTCYDLVLTERMKFRRADALDAASERVEDARRQIQKRESDHLSFVDQHHQVALSERDRLKDEYQRRIDQLSNVTDETLRRALTDEVTSLRKTINEVEVELHRLSTERSRRPIDDIDRQLREQMDDALRLRYELLREDPANRAGYRHAEVLIDVIRVVPPLIFGAFTSVRWLMFPAP